MWYVASNPRNTIYDLRNTNYVLLPPTRDIRHTTHDIPLWGVDHVSTKNTGKGQNRSFGGAFGAIHSAFGRSNAGGRRVERGWPEGRTRVAGGSNAGGRRVERGWPEGRTRLAARANAKTAPRPMVRAAKTLAPAANPLIFHGPAKKVSIISRAGTLCGLNLGPRAMAKYLQAEPRKNEKILDRINRMNRIKENMPRPVPKNPVHPVNPVKKICHEQIQLRFPGPMLRVPRFAFRVLLSPLLATRLPALYPF
jgi:hypothetical protein